MRDDKGTSRQCFSEKQQTNSGSSDGHLLEKITRNIWVAFSVVNTRRKDAKHSERVNIQYIHALFIIHCIHTHTLYTYAFTNILYMHHRYIFYIHTGIIFVYLQTHI